MSNQSSLPVPHLKNDAFKRPVSSSRSLAFVVVVLEKYVFVSVPNTKELSIPMYSTVADSNCCRNLRSSVSKPQRSIAFSATKSGGVEFDVAATLKFSINRASRALIFRGPRSQQCILSSHATGSSLVWVSATKTSVNARQTFARIGPPPIWVAKSMTTR